VEINLRFICFCFSRRKIIMLRSPAELLYDRLSGIACLFKPADMQMQHFFTIVQERLVSALNQMSCRSPMQRVDIIRNQQTGKEMVVSSVDLSDTVQALGPRYQPEDFDIQSIFPLEPFSSGVQIVSINYKSKRLDLIKDGQPLRCYHIQGRMGQSTNTLDANGVIVEKSTYKHVNRSKIERVCALIQSSFQASMYKMSGISPFTQAGFELAKAGLWKPRDHTLPPIVYGLKLLNFKPPFFDIEMHVINEREIHLKEVILDIGVRLRTSTLSESVRRSNIGPFTTQHSLVIDEITPDNLINNIQTIETLIEKTNLVDKTILVNKTHEEETKLLGKLSDENTVDLYQTKRPSNHSWQSDKNNHPNR
jgi:tRNA U55 pseudouridine synthase TruB